MPALIEAIHIKRKTLFEMENEPYVCLDSDISTPTARGGQTLVRLKMRNLLTSAVFDKTFKAQDKFKEPDLVLVPASYLYSDGDGSHFLDQESYETLTLTDATRPSPTSARSPVQPSSWVSSAHSRRPAPSAKMPGSRRRCCAPRPSG